MDTLPSIQDGLTPLVTYAIEDDETVVEAIVRAFGAAGVDTYDRDEPLYDWVPIDCLERFDWDSGRPLRVSTIIWDHPTIITDESVEVYDD
ncbi:MAG: hypothetical protein ACQET5_08590 [Halobacteriota archaeon]|uniref:hypothetical protein n=1 Tax=Natronomonas sp. TaxID=2184060 RepID=UPI0039747B2C